MSWTADMLGIDMGELFKEGLPTVVEPEDERWVSLPTAGYLTGYHPDSVRRYAREGVIASKKLSGRVVVSLAEVQALAKRHDRLSA